MEPASCSCLDVFRAVVLNFEESDTRDSPFHPLPRNTGFMGLGCGLGIRMLKAPS